MKNLINSQRTRTTLIGGFILVLALAGLGTSALAITWGEVDTEEAYPEVGAFIVERNDGRIWATCTGTLIHEQVFLTAAHCTSYVADKLATGEFVGAYVSFDLDVAFDETGNGPTLLNVAEVLTHPDYDNFSDPSNPYDVGALVLAEPVTGIELPELPTEGFLDGLKQDGTLHSGGPDGAKFTVAGYGGTLDWHGGEPLEGYKGDPPGGHGEPPEKIFYEDERQVAESEYVALVPAQLHMDQNRLHDNEGTCFGDSGGPAFWEPDEETRILVGITSWGDAMCIVTGFDYRVDIPDTLTFIDDVIEDYLP